MMSVYTYRFIFILYFFVIPTNVAVYRKFSWFIRARFVVNDLATQRVSTVCNLISSEAHSSFFFSIPLSPSVRDVLERHDGRFVPWWSLKGFLLERETMRWDVVQFSIKAECQAKRSLYFSELFWNSSLEWVTELAWASERTNEKYFSVPATGCSCGVETF